MNEELIQLLRNKTHLARLAFPEVREIFERLDELGYEIVRKSDGAIVEPVTDPVPVAEPLAWPTAIEPPEPIANPAPAESVEPWVPNVWEPKPNV